MFNDLIVLVDDNIQMTILVDVCCRYTITCIMLHVHACRIRCMDTTDYSETFVTVDTVNPEFSAAIYFWLFSAPLQ